MKLVQPIRDKNKIEEMKEQLKKNGTRDFMLFYTGINTGLRISDLVKLNRDDVRNKDGSMKTHITIIEKKTKKIKKFPIMNLLLVEMEKYTKNMQEGEYLFKSQKGNNKPISRRKYWTNRNRNSYYEKNISDIGIINNIMMLPCCKSCLIIVAHLLL